MGRYEWHYKLFPVDKDSGGIIPDKKAPSNETSVWSMLVCCQGNSREEVNDLKFFHANSLMLHLLETRTLMICFPREFRGTFPGICVRFWE